MRRNGRLLAAHATGQDALQAVKEVTDRLRRRMRSVAEAVVELRNEPRAIEKGLAGLARDHSHRPRARLKPPELRDTVVSSSPAPCRRS